MYKNTITELYESCKNNNNFIGHVMQYIAKQLEKRLLSTSYS